MGPLGFEPRTDGLKVSGSSRKTAPKQHGKCTKNSRNCRFQAKRARHNAVSAHLPDTKYDKYDAYGGVEIQVSGQNRTRVLI